MLEEDAIVHPSYPLHFPQELLEMIFNHVSDDKRTLRQCSLVCKAWVSAASSDLFRQLWWPPCQYHWDPPELTNESYRVWCCECHELGIATFAACAQALSSSSRVSVATRELILSSQRHTRSVFSSEPLSLETLESILCLLPGLRSLDLCNTLVQVASLPEEAKRGRHTLHTLQFDIGSDSRRHNVNELCHTLALFQSISHLELFPSDGRSDAFEPDDTLPLLPDCDLTHAVAVRSVHILASSGMAFPTRFCHALQAHIDPATLTTLRVNENLSRDLVSLAQAATNLHSLDYYANPESDLPSPVSQLRVLRIHSFVFLDCSLPPTGHWTRMTQNVERMAAPNVAQLRLPLRFGLMAYTLQDLEWWLTAMDWARLEKALQRYEALESLQIEVGWSSTVWSDHNMPDVLALVRNIAEARVSSKVFRLLEVVPYQYVEVGAHAP